MYEIVNSLWIADIQQVSEQATGRFDHVVNVCQDDTSDNVGCHYSHIPLADGEENAEQWGGSCGYSAFAAAAGRVVLCLQHGETVLVHCHAGQSRSAAVCIAALAVYAGVPFDTAHAKVEDARGAIHPTQMLIDHAHRYIEEYQ